MRFQQHKPGLSSLCWAQGGRRGVQVGVYFGGGEEVDAAGCVTREGCFDGEGKGDNTQQIS